MSEKPSLRVSDAERHAVVEVLRRGYGEGRLDLAEFEERTAAALAARVRSDLEPLTADLPAVPSAWTPPPARSSAGGREQPERTRPPRPGAAFPVPVRSVRWVVAVMGGVERRGRWRPDEETNAVAVMGGVELDLREAVLEGPEVVINAVAIMGGVDVVVPEGVPVELTGLEAARVGPAPATTGRSLPALGRLRRPGRSGHGLAYRLALLALMGAKDCKLADVPPRPGAPLVRVRAFAHMGGVSVRTKRPKAPKKAKGRQELGGPEER